MILTDEEISKVVSETFADASPLTETEYSLVKAIEAKILEKIGEPICYMHTEETLVDSAQSADFPEPLYRLPEVKEN